MTKIRLLLRELRQTNGLSQEELAQALKLSRQSIISLEQGEYLPSSPVLLAMLEFFNCSIEQLVEGMNIQYLKSSNNKEVKGDESMQLVPWSPYEAIDRVQGEMSDVIERTFGRGDWSRALGMTAGAMNIHETDKEYEIELQVPGFKEDELSIEMTQDTLTVSGVKKSEEKKEGKNLVRREWQHNEFRRQVHFSTPIKDEKVEAKLENGTLTITAPKVEPVKPKIKKIEVKQK